MIHLLFPVSVIIFSLIIDNWLSNLSFSKIIPSQCFHKDKSFTQDKIISGENLALKKPSLQSSGGPGGLGGDQTNFAPTLAVDGGEFCVRNRSEILRYWSLVSVLCQLSGDNNFPKQQWWQIQTYKLSPTTPLPLSILSTFFLDMQYNLNISDLNTCTYTPVSTEQRWWQVGNHNNIS